MYLSFIIPTRNRSEQLRQTLAYMGELDRTLAEQSELIVLDNASAKPMKLPDRLRNGIAIRPITLDRNHNTAARNIGAQSARGDWLVMLDDDSSPLDSQFGTVLGQIDDKVAAVGGEIMLTNGKHESGGLPEVIVGCGCAIRREAFMQVGGYDETFGYYAEEYDLCAKLIALGYRVTHSRMMRFEHRKSTIGRDMNEILYRLVRNNAWVMQRYSPRDRRERLLEETIERYRLIAEKERAMQGFHRGLAELEHSLPDQPERALPIQQWERFEGRTVVRESIQRHIQCDPAPMRLVGPAHGKGRSIIESELFAHGCVLTNEPSARAIVSTLSPGPMLDTLDAQPEAISPSLFEDFADKAHTTPV